MNLRFAFLTLLFHSLYINAQNVDTNLNQINAIFKDYNNNEIPGVSLGFIKDNEIKFLKSYGMANLENDISINENTVFNLASVSKHFTTFAILLLEQDKKLSLDDEILQLQL